MSCCRRRLYRAESVSVCDGITTITLSETPSVGHFEVGLFVPIEGNSDCTNVVLTDGENSKTVFKTCGNVGDYWLPRRIACRSIIGFFRAPNSNEIFVTGVKGRGCL